MLYVRDENYWHAVYTSRSLYRGEVIYTLSSNKKLVKPTRTSIEIYRSYHVEDPLGRYINHSCTPTCMVVGLNIVAIKDIEEDEEITFDYTKNESSLAHSFKCKTCKQVIEGFPAPCLIKN